MVQSARYRRTMTQKSLTYAGFLSYPTWEAREEDGREFTLRTARLPSTISKISLSTAINMNQINITL